jgi:hypothetical protein
MDKRIGIIPIPAFTSISISREAHTLFKAEKVAYQAKIGKELSDSNFLLRILLSQKWIKK